MYCITLKTINHGKDFRLCDGCGHNDMRLRAGVTGCAAGIKPVRVDFQHLIFYIFYFIGKLVAHGGGLFMSGLQLARCG